MQLHALRTVLSLTPPFFFPTSPLTLSAARCSLLAARCTATLHCACANDLHYPPATLARAVAPPALHRPRLVQSSSYPPHRHCKATHASHAALYARHAMPCHAPAALLVFVLVLGLPATCHTPYSKQFYWDNARCAVAGTGTVLTTVVRVVGSGSGSTSSSGST
jgi:hypothetical protein